MVDLVITATAVVAGSDATVEHGTLGATTVAGQPVYKVATTSKFNLSDNDSATAEAKAVYGIALNGGADGQPGAVLKSGDLTVNAVLTAGTPYYLSSTAGGICPFADLGAGDRVIQIGLAKSTTVLAVRPFDTGVTL